MASGSGKRKRPERQGSYGEPNGRPSPHRPEALNLAQQTQRESGRRGPPRQGKAGLSAPSSPAPAVRESDGAPGRGDGAVGSAIGAVETRPVTPAPVPAVQEEAVTALEAREYAYEYLTKEVLAGWEDTGRQAVLNAVAAGDELVVSAVVQELVTAGLDGKLDPVVAGETVKELIARQEEGSDIGALFLDTISLLDDTDSKNTALGKIVTATGIDPEIVRQELDVSLLMALQLTRTTFERMRTRKTTSLLYRQANFNLLREETEGYAKLLTDYYNAASDSVNSDDTEM
ncbi:THO2 plays a role in transcriptional elongation, partial [Oleoguttula sp. CCFEE 5521]